MFGVIARNLSNLRPYFHITFYPLQPAVTYWSATEKIWIEIITVARTKIYKHTHDIGQCGINVLVKWVPNTQEQKVNTCVSTFSTTFFDTRWCVLPFSVSKFTESLCQYILTIGCNFTYRSFTAQYSSVATSRYLHLGGFAKQIVPIPLISPFVNRMRTLVSIEYHIQIWQV